MKLGDLLLAFFLAVWEKKDKNHYRAPLRSQNFGQGTVSPPSPINHKPHYLFFGHLYIGDQDDH
ncbi:MAG: hypothetical protein A2026_00655 [Deltaproteobacteria bacterium RBG_19FT_COMBO_46_12]|nr:MAG: hypothetical protein A2026_00655 [Deltaproteobacteria bacterium RBG_19FT_COMBO_46_12]